MLQTNNILMPLFNNNEVVERGDPEESSDDEFMQELFEGPYDDTDKQNSNATSFTYRDIHPSGTTTFQLNKGRTTALKHAIKEIEFMLQQLTRLCHKSNHRDVTMSDLASLFYGPEGYMTSTMKQAIGTTDVSTVYRFLSTYCLQLFIAKDATNFYKTLDVLDANDKVVMDKGEYFL